MKILRLVSLSLLAACLAVLTGVVTGEAASAPPPPTLVAVRAAHHPGFDRIVYQFEGGLPSIHRIRYVDRLVGDASGLPVRIAGRAILRVPGIGTMSSPWWSSQASASCAGVQPRACASSPTASTTRSTPTSPASPSAPCRHARPARRP